MRLKITYESIKGEILLPIHYNYVIHSLIYSSFSDELATKLHTYGFEFGKRKFKLFTFSRIIERGKLVKGEGLKEIEERLGVKRVDGEMLLFKTITFYFSSPFEDIIADFGDKSFTEREFNIMGQRVFVSNIEVLTNPRIDEDILIRMLSPLTIHSTLKKEDGGKLSYFYKPHEKEFSTLIERNAKRKYMLIYKKEADGKVLRITPYRFSHKKNLKVVKFKGTIINGFTGIYRLTGSRELISVTYDAGLGDRNSEGFGMWEPWSPKERRQHA